MTMNIYYSVMSVYGWYKWNSKSNGPDLKITRTTHREKVIGVLLFIATALITYLVYKFFDYKLEIPNYIDIFTSGLFFTAMWYMALKKIENWALGTFKNLKMGPSKPKIRFLGSQKVEKWLGSLQKLKI